MHFTDLTLELLGNGGLGKEILALSNLSPMKGRGTNLPRFQKDCTKANPIAEYSVQVNIFLYDNVFVDETPAR